MAIKISKRQKQFIDDLFDSGGDEGAVLEKYKISSAKYSRWLEDEDFAKAMQWRILSAKRQSQILLAKYIPVAAAKLIGLCDSEKEETARRACLDILEQRQSQVSVSRDNGLADEQVLPLSPQLASKLLSVLAEKD